VCPSRDFPDINCIYRASRLIRGEQIAEYLGAKHNPTSGYENDICIYIKPRRVSELRDGDYVDIMDHQYNNFEQLRERPGINVIAYSQLSCDHIRSKIPNKVVIIPEHHCNFERIVRDRKEIKVGGYLGHPSITCKKINDGIAKRLKEIGLDFVACYDYKNRNDVIEFYKKIDFQIIGDFDFSRNGFVFIHSNKLVNAASFGIPTLAEHRNGYDEFDGCYLRVKNMEDIIKQIELLRDNNFYNNFSDKIRLAAESYHISNIAKLYKQLM
jgi:hypothetical protein